MFTNKEEKNEVIVDQATDNQQHQNYSFGLFKQEHRLDAPESVTPSVMPLNKFKEHFDEMFAQQALEEQFNAMIFKK